MTTFLPQHAQALTLEHTLFGHTGCVNRIHWDETGSCLVSGSDDKKVFVWQYPDIKRLPVALTTRHRANIFGAQILPQTNGYKVVSCSMDRSVQLHELDPNALDVPYGTGAHLSEEAGSVAGGIGQPRAVQPRTTNYTCHSGRVKDVEVEPMNPHNFWSASEDGTVRQFDCRCRTDQQAFSDSSNLLVQVRDLKTRDPVELKSLDICQSHPHLLALACNDPYVRVYDRRKLFLSSPASQPASGTPALMELAPAHLAIGSRASPAHSTYVCFSQKGDRVVTSYHRDHAYAYDVTSAGCTSAVYPVPRSVEQHVTGNGCGWKAVTLLPVPSRQQGNSTEGNQALPVSAAWERDAGDEAAGQNHFFTAMSHYERALHLAPWSAALWSHRAEALLNRGWRGDELWALRDCDVCLSLDPGFWQARMQRARALEAMEQIRAALGAVEDAAAVRAQTPRGQQQDNLAERQIAALREQLESRLSEDRKWEFERTQCLRHRRKFEYDTSRGIVPVPTEVAGSEAGRASQQGPGAATPEQQQQQQRRQQEAEEESGRERCAQGNVSRPVRAVGDELVGREEEEEEEEDGVRGTSDRQQSDMEQDEDQEAAEAVFMEYYGFDSAESSGSHVGPLPPDCGRFSRSSRSSRRAGRGAEAMVQASMPGGSRLLQRYMGHINVQTDIKEASFLGGGDALVACGSDDGKVYIYDATSGMPLKVLQADQDVVNCVQGHPHLPVLATSGIEDVIRLWAPGEAGSPAGLATRLKLEDQIANNQERFSDDSPTISFSTLMQSPRLVELLMGGIPHRREGHSTDSDEEEDEGGAANVRCRVN